MKTLLDLYNAAGRPRVMKKIMSILGEFLVAGSIGLAVAWLIVWAIDDEERLVRAGIKEHNSTILPVIGHDQAQTPQTR